MPLGLSSGTRGQFRTTRWSVVAAAGSGDGEVARQALERLGQAYWYPLYAYARRLGEAPADAEDLTQSFFAYLIGKEVLAKARQERGRFRTFLLAAFKNHIAQTRRAASAQKRGGQLSFVPLDLPRAEEIYAREPVDSWDPERLFERRWAMTILETSLAELEREFVAKGAAEVHRRLKGCLEGELDPQGYVAIGAAWGMSEQAVKGTVHRMRMRLRELVRKELARLVADAAELEDEFRHWVCVLRAT